MAGHLRSLIVFALSCQLACVKAETASRELVNFEEVVRAIDAAERLTLVVDNTECGIDVPLLAAGVIDFKKYRVDFSESGDPASISTATNFLAGATVPDNPFVLVVITVSIGADNSVGFLFSDLDLRNGWTPIRAVSGECSLGAGAKVFAHSDPDQPAQPLANFEAVKTAFFDEGRPLWGRVNLGECSSSSGTLPRASLVIQSVLSGYVQASTQASIDVDQMVVLTTPDGDAAVEFYPTVRLTSDGILNMDIVMMDPATGDILSEESYQCPLGSAASFLAGPQAPEAVDAPLLSDFGEIRDSFLAGNKMRMRLDISACETGSWPLGETMVVGPIPWEYIVVPGKKRGVLVREVYRYDLETVVLQVYEEGLVNVTHFRHSLVTGEQLEMNQAFCQLDGVAAGFIVFNSEQQQITKYASVVETMLTTGKLHATVTNFNFCELPQSVEYGGTGSYYEANYLLNDNAGSSQYLFSPMSGLEPIAAFNPQNRDGVGMHDFPMLAIEPVDVAFNERYFDAVTFEKIKGDFIFICNINNGTDGAVAFFA